MRRESQLIKEGLVSTFPRRGRAGASFGALPLPIPLGRRRRACFGASPALLHSCLGSSGWTLMQGLFLIGLSSNPHGTFGHQVVPRKGTQAGRPCAEVEQERVGTPIPLPASEATVV